MPALGPLIIVSGPAGGGKTTVIRAVEKVCRKPIRVAVTATTRPPREGEMDGREYHFWTKEKFLAEIAAGSFLEYAVVHESDYYGTPRSEVEPFRRAGLGVILIIDVQGASQVREQYPEAFSIFMHAPNDDYLERLQKRGDSADSIQRRLRSAEKELARSHEYSAQLTNDVLDQTVEKMCELIERQFHSGKGT